MNLIVSSSWWGRILCHAELFRCFGSVSYNGLGEDKSVRSTAGKNRSGDAFRRDPVRRPSPAWLGWIPSDAMQVTTISRFSSSELGQLTTEITPTGPSFIFQCSSPYSKIDVSPRIFVRGCTDLYHFTFHTYRSKTLKRGHI